MTNTSKDRKSFTDFEFVYTGGTLKLRPIKLLFVIFGKGVPPQDPYFLKNGQINRVSNFSSTLRPTESDSAKKLGGYLDSKRGSWI